VVMLVASHGNGYATPAEKLNNCLGAVSTSGQILHLTRASGA